MLYFHTFNLCLDIYCYKLTTGTFKWGKSDTQAYILNVKCADVNSRHISA